jgi:hypothetical protein
LHGFRVYNLRFFWGGHLVNIYWKVIGFCKTLGFGVSQYVIGQRLSPVVSAAILFTGNYAHGCRLSTVTRSSNTHSSELTFCWLFPRKCFLSCLVRHKSIHGLASGLLLYSAPLAEPRVAGSSCSLSTDCNYCMFTSALVAFAAHVACCWCVDCIRCLLGGKFLHYHSKRL